MNIQIHQGDEWIIGGTPFIALQHQAGIVVFQSPDGRNALHMTDRDLLERSLSGQAQRRFVPRAG